MTTSSQENSNQTEQKGVNPALLEILACPQCKSEKTGLNYEPEKSRFTCTACKLVFSIKDGIPNFIVQEASPL